MMPYYTRSLIIHKATFPVFDDANDISNEDVAKMLMLTFSFSSVQGLCELLQGEGGPKSEQAGQMGFGGGECLLLQIFFVDILFNPISCGVSESFGAGWGASGAPLELLN